MELEKLRPELLSADESSGSLIKNSCSDSVGLGRAWDFSNKCPGDAIATGLRPHLEMWGFRWVLCWEYHSFRTGIFEFKSQFLHTLAIKV